MDQLDVEQLEQLKKCGIKHLRFKLIHVGEDEEAVIDMDPDCWRLQNEST